MAAGPRDSQNKIIQKKLQAVVLRAAVGGYNIFPIVSAIHVQFNEGKGNPKDILDAFPEDLDMKWKHSLLKVASFIFFRLLLSGDVELNPGPGEGQGRLSTKDLMVVQSELWDARSKWRNIGIQLHMKIEDLEAIGEKYLYAPDACFTDCITTWLRQTNPPPTWTALINALRSRPVGFQEMAEGLEGKYLHPSLTANHVFKFPHIDEVAMDEQQKEELEQRLVLETEDIQFKFCTLISKFFDTLENEQIPIERLVRYVEEPLGKEMKHLSTIKDVRCIIKENSSFFDYQFLGYMIELAGTESNKEQLSKYKDAFEVYAQRRVFECPCQFRAKRNPNDTELHVKLDERYECKLDELKKFQSRLSVILKVCVYVIRLFSVEKGCFQLVFLVSKQIQASTFPLSVEQEKGLVRLCVLWLSCGSYLFSSPSLKAPSTDSDDSANSSELMKGMEMVTQVTETPSPQVLSDQHTLCTDKTDYVAISGDYGAHSSETQSNVAKSEETKPGSVVGGSVPVFSELTPRLMPMITTRSRESENMLKKIHFQQKKLQAVVLRAAVGGYVSPIELAVHVCVTKLNEGKGNAKDILDTFPENVDVKVQKKYHCHSPLMIACEDDRDNIVEVLLKNEATVALRNKCGLTAVHIVCRKGNLNILNMLLEKAKDQRVYYSKKGRAALPSDCEAVLLTRTREGWYPVMYAVKEGHVELVKECFDKVEQDITTEKKQTVLHIAARAGQLDCLKEIVPKVSDDLKTAIDKSGWNVLHHACASDNPEVLKWLMDNMRDVCTDMLKQKCKCGYTPLSTACEYKKEEIVQYLLSLPDVNVAITVPTDPESEERERTALHIAAAHNSLNIVKLLIDKKHPLTIKDKNGDTALHYAYRSLSTDVINYLEHHVLGMMDIKNDNNELPNKVKRKDVIPLEISRRGENAIEIYKRVLKKGKKKIPRCNLLILGEERVGKTSLYRLLVRKDFNQDLKPTKGIDGNDVDIVDERSVTMGDKWKEKPKKNQEEQIGEIYVNCMSETLHAELPPKKIKQKYEPEPVLSEDELMKRIEDIRMRIDNIHEDLIQLITKRTPSQFHVVHKARVDEPPSHRHKHAPIAPPKPSQDEHEVQSHPQKSITPMKGHQDKSKSEDIMQKVHKDSENSHVSSESEEVDISSEIVSEKLKREAQVVSISRRESLSMNKMLKAKRKQAVNTPAGPTQLELRVLDFAGQKQYRPMHHCFITRRAIYLVVFNLQKMIEYIEMEESTPSSTIESGDVIPSSPIEQLRYWLYSIHAHVFPPNEDDNMRRVCLVGTHRLPKGRRQISEDEIKKIDERLKREFKRDERCINLFHYMGPSKAKLIFTCVENSIDGKEDEHREKSGALSLQKELKEVSSQLKFLDEDHPLIWLRFEQGLIKMRQGLINSKLPLFVTVDEVLKLAESQGMDDAESKELALNFLHDTGKLVYLERVPTLYLSEEEQKELAKLIILDPAWLTKVMRAVVELDSHNVRGDRTPAMTLSEDGIASKELLMNIWAEFLPDTEDRDQLFHHLCTILKAYCLIYPLKESTIPNTGDKSEEPSFLSGSSSSESSERQSVTINELFLIPCMLPENIQRRDDSHLNWITFYFDFEKFLPEVLYHRFVCQLLADCHTPPQCSKSWSRFNSVHGCNWIIEPMRNLHQLRISVLTRDMTTLSQLIVYIDENYLRRICAESEFKGLKYHGGPAAKCQCKEENLRVLHFVSFCMKNNKHTISDKPKLVIDCEHCLTSQNVEELLQLQVKDRSGHVTSIQSPSVSSSEDIKAQQVVEIKPNKLGEAFKLLIPLKQHWRNIGVILELDNGELGKINTECRSIPDDCLREMLSLWLKQVSPRPTRKALAEAVKRYDANISQEILTCMTL